MLTSKGRVVLAGDLRGVSPSSTVEQIGICVALEQACSQGT